MNTYNVVMRWAHGLTVETFLRHASMIELFNHIGKLVVIEEEGMRAARNKDSFLPIPTLVSTTIKIVQ